MGLWAWLHDEEPPKTTRVRIPISRIDHHQASGWWAGNGPDMRPHNRGLMRTEGPPIKVKRRNGRYQIYDGNDRVGYARRAGRTHIWADVIE